MSTIDPPGTPLTIRVGAHDFHVNTSNEGRVEVARVELTNTFEYLDPRRKDVEKADANRDHTIDEHEAKNLPRLKLGFFDRLFPPKREWIEANQQIGDTFDEIAKRYRARRTRIADGTAANESFPRILKLAGMEGVKPISLPLAEVYQQDDRLLLRFKTGMTFFATGVGPKSAPLFVRESLASTGDPNPGARDTRWSVYDQEGTRVNSSHPGDERSTFVELDVSTGTLAVGQQGRGAAEFKDATTYDLRTGAISRKFNGTETHRIEGGTITKVRALRGYPPSYVGRGCFSMGQNMSLTLPVMPEVLGPVRTGRVPEDAIS